MCTLFAVRQHWLILPIFIWLSRLGLWLLTRDVFRIEIQASKFEFRTAKEPLLESRTSLILELDHIPSGYSNYY